MKRRINTLLCLTLAITLILGALSSCTKPKSETVFSYGEASINENLYFYELARMKVQALQEYSGASVDIPSLWSQVMTEGVTFDDYIYAQCQFNIGTLLYFADYALSHGGELTKDEKKEIKKSADGLVESFGTKGALNKHLEAYNINYDMYIDYLELYALSNKGLSLAYGEGGERAISYEEVKKYYEENFVTVKHIAIGTEFAGTNEDGSYVYYTDEEKAEKRRLISEIETALKSGESFDDYVPKSEDGFSKTYPNGYTITKGVLDITMQGYENVAMGLEVGEWDTFELEGTSFYFIKRVELLESDLQNCAQSIVMTLRQLDMASAVIEHYDELYMNQEIIDNYNIAMIPVLNIAMIPVLK